MRWSLQGPDSRFNVSIASGLVIGEDERGNFEIAPADQRSALVRFDVEGREVRIHVVSRAWALARPERMVGESFRSERPIELKLPHNVIQVVGGDDPAAQPERLELTPRQSVNWLRPTPLRTDTRGPDTLADRAVPATETLTEKPVAPSAWELPEDADTTVPAPTGPRSGEHQPEIFVDPAIRHSAPERAPARRTLHPLTATLIGVGGAIAVALWYRGDDPGAASVDPAPSAVATAPVAGGAEAAAAVTVPDPVEETNSGTIDRSSEPEWVSAPAIQPALSLDQPSAESPLEGATVDARPEPGPAAAAAVQPVVPPPAVEQRPPARAPAASVAQRRETGAPSQAAAAQQTRERLLLAANVALAQGRLTTPPQSSAYALYSRVLELDPKSAEAQSGLQSVRQGLVNRALAELARGALDDARASLDAAEETGANPTLVADLRGEVEYRQRVIDAQARP